MNTIVYMDSTNRILYWKSNIKLRKKGTLLLYLQVTVFQKNVGKQIFVFKINHLSRNQQQVLMSDGFERNTICWFLIITIFLKTVRSISVLDDKSNFFGYLLVAFKNIDIRYTEFLSTNCETLRCIEKYQQR